LQKCDPNSIMSAAFVAASFDLPIDSNLGFSAIVPYKTSAQFQMMYKGFIQLAVRTGQYKGMNAAEVYEDELVSYNPITKEAAFVSVFPKDSQRNRGEKEKIVGYYAWFELVNGFKQSLFMNVDEIENHAKQYSQAYGYDLREKKRASKWSTDFDAMAKKTVIKLLLSKWGILSIDMQRALTVDQEVYTNKGAKYIDNPEVANKQIEDPFQNEPASKTHLQTISKMVSELNCDYPVLDEYFVDLGITDKDKMTRAQAEGAIKFLAKKMDEVNDEVKGGAKK
jgi:recombination protein RecT